MSPASRRAAEAERQIQAESRRGNHAAALELALSTYGEELLSFLVAFTPDQDQAREVFSELCERLWRGLPGFRWECSFRTWAYLLARRATIHHRQARGRRERPDGEGDHAEVPYRERSSTLPWLRTNVKAQFRELRAKLSIEEQQLLVLRVDRQMGWIDVARVMEGAGPDAGADLTARAAALRQRFHTLKERLKALAHEEGLIPADFR